jgi:alpha-N-acetylglucosaminidase
MWWSQPLLWLCAALTAVAQSTEGIEDLVKRRMPNHVDSFHFTLVDANTTISDSHDSYIVSSASDGKIQV